MDELDQVFEACAGMSPDDIMSAIEESGVQVDDAAQLAAYLASRAEA